MSHRDDVGGLSVAALSLPESSSAAVHDWGRSYTYDEFRQIVHQYSDLLVERNSQMVVIDIPQGVAAYAAIWACYLSNVTFVTLYPDTPLVRKRRVLDRVHADTMLVHNPEDPLNPLIEKIPANDGRPLRNNDIAYVLFTSGSTGEPKGVAVGRRALENLIRWSHLRFGMNQHTVWAQYFALGFDLALFDVFAALSAGSSLVPFDTLGDKLRPFEKIAKNAVTHWHSVPTAIDIWPATNLASSAIDSLTTFLFCGEALTWAQVHRLREHLKGCAIYNNYGPTETTMFVTSYKVPADISRWDEDEPTVPLGDAIPGNTVVLDDADDGRGEIIVKGISVAKGYLDGPQGGFGRDVRGEPTYRTGDFGYGRYQHIYYGSREDTQVKRNGYRVDLAEIEGVLTFLGYPECYARIEGGSIIVCYSGEIDLDALCVKLAEEIPNYMMPDSFQNVESIPRTPSGKVDRKALGSSRHLGTRR